MVGVGDSINYIPVGKERVILILVGGELILILVGRKEWSRLIFVGRDWQVIYILIDRERVKLIPIGREERSRLIVVVGVERGIYILVGREGRGKHILVGGDWWSK